MFQFTRIGEREGAWLKSQGSVVPAPAHRSTRAGGLLTASGQGVCLHPSVCVFEANT